MQGFVLVFLGAGSGGMLRHGANLLAARWSPSSPQLGTLAVNVIGSLALLLLAAWFSSRGRAPDSQWLFVATGVIGGFTTFSAFSLDATMLWSRGQTSAALWYVGSSVALSLAATFAGMRMGARVF